MLAAELVAAGLDDPAETICGVELFDAPGFRLPDRPVGHRHVADERPVGADDAVEAEAAAQQAGDHVLVEAEADRLELRADRTAVVGHDLRGPGGESRLERAAGGPRSARRDRPDPCRTGSAGPRRRPAGRRRGSASSCRRRWSGRARRPGSRGCRPPSGARRARSPRRTCRTIRAQRGSVATSAIGCSATWIPTARYSCRAIVAEAARRAPRRRRRRARSARATARTSRRPARRRRSRRTSGAGRMRSSPGCRAASPRPAAAAGCATRRSSRVRARRRC